MSESFYVPPHSDPSYTYIVGQLKQTMQRAPHFQHPLAHSRFGSAPVAATIESTSVSTPTLAPTATIVDTAYVNHRNQLFSTLLWAMNKGRNAQEKTKATDSLIKATHPHTCSVEMTIAYPTPATATALVAFLAAETNCVEGIGYLVKECGANVYGAYERYYPAKSVKSPNGESLGGEGTAPATPAATCTPTLDWEELGGKITVTHCAYKGNVAGGTITKDEVTMPDTQSLLNSTSVAEQSALRAHADGLKTPLHYAAAAGRAEMCRALIHLAATCASDANEEAFSDCSVAACAMRFINRKDSVGRTALHYACRGSVGGMACVAGVIGLGRGPLVGVGIAETDAHLMDYQRWGSESPLRLDVNASDTLQGATAVHEATRQGRLDVVKLLVYGEGLGITNVACGSDGTSPLTSHPPCYPYPLASVSLPDLQGNTALHLAARFIRSDGGFDDRLLAAALKIADDTSLGLNCRNNLGQTPLHLAAAEQNLGAVEVLLRYNKGSCGRCTDGVVMGVNTHAADVDTPSLSQQRLQYCPRCHCDVDVLDAKGRTPLHYLCMDRYPSIPCVALLLKYGASASLKERGTKMAALALASKYVRLPPPSRMQCGDEEITVFGLLMDHGAGA